MTTDNEVVTETVAEPVIDQTAAERAKLDAQMKEQRAKEQAEHEKMMADMAKRRAEEAAIAAVQDAALKAVKDQCDAYRAALAQE